MKWKVLIVDDDMNFRYAMREMIPWAENGFEVAAEAVHGRQALEMLEKKEIHIVLTDMEMPVMNGVELTAEVKKLYPDIIVMALSAFDDFEFVKESMRLGAEDYILKQEFDGERIMGALKRLCGKKLESHNKKFNMARENEAFIAFLQGKTDKLPPESPYQSLTNKTNMTLYLVQSDNTLDIRMKEEADLLFFARLREGIQVLICQMRETGGRNQWSQELLRLAGKIQSSALGRFRIALCDDSGGFSHLPGMYQKAKLALEYGVYFPKERFLHYLDIIRFENVRKRDFVYQMPDGVSMPEGEEDCGRLLTEMGEQLVLYKPEEEFVNTSFVNFYKSFLLSLAGEADDMDMLRYYEGLKEHSSIEEKLAYTAADISKSRESVKARYAGKHRSIQMAIDYVYKNYARDISLTDIAEYAGLSENYFSNLFKREMDENLVSFINKVRIEKAKKLLENSNFKVNEIAEMVGVRNGTYLSTMFKKMTGMSISDYKNQTKNTP